jgi:integrase
MAKNTAVLYIRVKQADGTYRFEKPLYAANGRLRSQDGVYHLRYTSHGKRVWENIGTDATVALVAQKKKNVALQGSALGLAIPEAPGAAVGAAEAKPDPEAADAGKRRLTDCVTEYLGEMKEHKAHGTWQLRSIMLTQFAEAVGHKRTFVEDVTRKDLLDFAAWMKKKGLSPMTVRKRVDQLQIFLHHFGLPSLLKGKDLPTFTEKVVRAYGQEVLDKMFGVATQDESDLLHFLLCTGGRRREAQFACWTDVDFERKTYTVTEHADLGFTPKDKEEGSIPIPDLLVDVLTERRKKYPKNRLIFPNKDDQPNQGLLRVIKKLALRAGVNCGHCVSKFGESCADKPVCKNVFLHKLRKTYASRLHKNGLPARTLMRYLRHSDLETTLKYLADEDDEHTRDIVNAAFK